MLAAHNAPFDIAFLTAACKDCSLPWPAFPGAGHRMELAHRVLGEEEVADCKLATLATHFNTRIKPPGAAGRCPTRWRPRTCSPHCCAGSPPPVCARFAEAGCV